MLGNPLTPSAGYTPSLPNAITPASKQELAKKRKPTGDGCRAKKVVQAQGYLDDAHVNATLEFLGKRLTLRIVKVESDASVVYRGNLDQSMCAHAEPGDLLGLSADMEASGATPRHFNVSVERNSFFDVNRERLHLEGFEKNRTGPTLRLWETPEHRLELRDRFQKVLKTSADVEAVVRAPNGRLLVVYVEPSSRGVHLAELSGSPLELTRHVETGLACNYADCDAELHANEVMAGVIVLVPVIEGQMCGAKCSDYAEAELWTLTSSGFRLGAKLPGSDHNPGGLFYDSSGSSTNLDWVDGDRIVPREILVRHKPSSEPESFLVLGFDPETKTYSRSEPMSPLDYDTLRTLLLGSFVGF